MKRTLLFILAIFWGISSNAQQLSGQWTGNFVSNNESSDYSTSYVLELEIKGNSVEGFSYTYFYISGKRCYVICRLEGSYDKGSKSLEVTEVERVKSNTPPDFKDCLQTHILTYFKAGGIEMLKGKWKSASLKDDCGSGNSEFERKTLANINTKPKTTPLVKNTNPKQNAINKPKIIQENSNPIKQPLTSNLPPAKKIPLPLVKVDKPAPKKPLNPIVSKPQVAIIKKTIPTTNEVPAEKKNIVIAQPEKPSPNEILTPIIKNTKIDTRIKQVIKVIEVESKTFKVDLYDNGQVDGDTISLYFNGKLMVTHQRLSLTPISLTLTLAEGSSDNELEMYAENLGSIPPNSALMVVTYGDKRFEVNITSSEQTNGTVRFKLKE
jgi:hypothetical protein